MYTPPLSPARTICLTSCNNFPSRLSPYILYSSSELFVGCWFINPIKMGCNLYQVEGSDIRVRCCSGVLGEESTFFIEEMWPKCWAGLNLMPFVFYTVMRTTWFRLVFVFRYKAPWLYSNFDWNKMMELTSACKTRIAVLARTKFDVTSFNSVTCVTWRVQNPARLL